MEKLLGSSIANLITKITKNIIKQNEISILTYIQKLITHHVRLHKWYAFIKSNNIHSL
jgi:hypothetical protein